MKTMQFIVALFAAMSALTACQQQTQPIDEERPRVLISTDIGGPDEDDFQSMGHLLMFNDYFDLEGLVSSPSFGGGGAEHIKNLIDLYAKDFKGGNFRTAEELKAMVHQGVNRLAPSAGYRTATDGSEWIVKCARTKDPRPLYVLVWGGLEDLAQALHDAPDIADRIRVYWIGGPNKKWGVNAYMYIVEQFPDLWMIENNTTYRGYIYDSKNDDEWNMGYFEKYIKDAGNLGRDFAAYYKGNPKMGDTPTLLHLMSDNDPEQPEQLSWAGRFVKTQSTPRRVFYGPTSAADTAQVCGIIEWRLKGPVCEDLAIDTPCLTLDIRNQQWKGYYKGDGNYVLRHSTYYTGTLSYTITSTVEGFEPIAGEITVVNTWDVAPMEDDLKVGSQWWTDSYAPADMWRNYAGANTQIEVRLAIMADWAARWQVLAE